MRRKPGNLLPLETAICVTAGDLLRDGTGEFHGYELARRLGDLSDHRLLTAYGTLYRALARLEKMGLLTSRAEAPELAASESRPARRLYSLTAAGAQATVAAARTGPAPDTQLPVRAVRRARRGWAPA